MSSLPPPAFTLWNPVDFHSPSQLLSPPCIAVRSDGTVLLVVNTLVNGNAQLGYAVGKVDIGKQQVHWSSTQPTPFYSTDGTYFSLAMNDEGLVVICYSSGTSLSYLLCRLTSEGALLPFGSATGYDTGIYPSVTVNNQGVILELHASDDDNQQRGYYHCGTVDVSLITNFAQNGTGLFTANSPIYSAITALNDSNQVIVGYDGATAQVGVANFKTGTVENDQVQLPDFSEWQPLGGATAAVMAMDNQSNVLAITLPNTEENFSYQTGVMDGSGTVTLSGAGTGWNASKLSASLSATNGWVVVASLDAGAPRNFMAVSAGVWG